MSRLLVCDHPLVREKLAFLRDKRTRPPEFRRLMAEVSTLLGYEALRGLPTRATRVQTPLRAAAGSAVEPALAFVAVLRAGLGMLDGLLRLSQAARIGHIGLYRNEETLNPVRYYVRLPQGLGECVTLLCDPMLATGGSAIEALRILKTDGARRIGLVSLLASREGIAKVQGAHPDVAIVVGAVDPRLNRLGYIVPGLGDAGDRLYGT